jgi:hypothetical protein
MRKLMKKERGGIRSRQCPRVFVLKYAWVSVTSGRDRHTEGQFEALE